MLVDGQFQPDRLAAALAAVLVRAEAAVGTDRGEEVLLAALDGLGMDQLAGFVDAQEEEGRALRPVALQPGRPVADPLEGEAEARRKVVDVVLVV